MIIHGLFWSYLCLFWYSSAACQVSLVQPWFAFRWNKTNLLKQQNLPKSSYQVFTVAKLDTVTMMWWPTISGQWLDAARHQGNTPNANMADHSVGTWDELHESEASVFFFDNASPEKSCFVDGLLCFILLCLLVFVFLNATRRDRNCPTFASKGK